MDLPKITDLDVSGKRVLLRLDLDTNPDPNDLRIRASEKTLDHLKEKASEIIIIAHRGRPDGKVDESLSLKPFQSIFDKWGAKVEENLRFDPGEEVNDPVFAKKLAALGDVYVNEAFASSHREHASIVGLPKLLPHAAGFRFIEEIENLSRVLDNPKRPVVVVLGGVKEDKLDYIEPLSRLADRVLVAGRLPEYMEKLSVIPAKQDPALRDNPQFSMENKVIVANLTPDREDITINSIEKFKEEIGGAGTIVLSGTMGKYEDEGHLQGTKEVFEAIVESDAFKVAGGGDTEAAITALSLVEGFDWISVGGGAMLEFLAKGTLPGIKALEK